MQPKKPIESLILTLRGQKVILDADLAEIYGVPTKVLNQTVKRNSARFPADFIFQLTATEFENMQSQIATISPADFPMRSQFVTASKIAAPEPPKKRIGFLREGEKNDE